MKERFLHCDGNLPTEDFWTIEQIDRSNLQSIKIDNKCLKEGQ